MIPRRAMPRCNLAAACALVLAVATCSAAQPPLEEARRLLMRGSYAEAGEAYAALLSTEPVSASLGKARVLVTTGEYESALDLLAAAAKSHANSADVRAELAQIEFARGNYDAAQGHVDAALSLDAEQVIARWTSAELHRTSGRLDEANHAYRWFIDYYNRTQRVDDPEVLLYVGRGAAQYARWNRLSDQFSFLVNDLLPDAIELEADFWPAHYEAGLLYLE